jgi:hypothetical protein
MITSAERAMLATDFKSLRKLWIFRARAESGRIANERSWMESQGFERVDADPGFAILPDGREVIKAAGATWALRADVHADRLATALKNARKKTPSTPGEGVSAVLCPACKSVMAKSPVCPGCAKGRAGFKILCICTECSHEVYL